MYQLEQNARRQMNQSTKRVSETDDFHLEIIDQNVRWVWKNAKPTFDVEGKKILDVAPGSGRVLSEYFERAEVESLDMVVRHNVTYVADLCNFEYFEQRTAAKMDRLVAETYDAIFCTEVLEHVENPFLAVKSLHLLLKKGGTLFVTTPFDFRIHGPLPDRWRFTEYGLTTLLSSFSHVSVVPRENDDRFLMPVCYAAEAVR